MVQVLSLLLAVIIFLIVLGVSLYFIYFGKEKGAESLKEIFDIEGFLQSLAKVFGGKWKD